MLDDDAPRPGRADEDEEDLDPLLKEFAQPLGCVNRAALILLGLIMATLFGWIVLWMQMESGGKPTLSGYVFGVLLNASFSSIALFNAGMVIILVIGPKRRFTLWVARKGRKALALFWLLLVLLFVGAGLNSLFN